jgi:hypothetical protein
MNYILHFFFTIQYNIRFRNKRNAYINPFPTIICVGVLRRVGISKRCLMSESSFDESPISCRKDLADFNLGF